MLLNEFCVMERRISLSDAIFYSMPEAIDANIFEQMTATHIVSKNITPW